MRSRRKNPSHEQMLTKGYSLEHPTKKQPKNYITSLAWGNNGRRYWKVEKMSKRETNIWKSYRKREKAGKEIYFTYEPNSLMMDFIFKYNLKVKKDKLGNVTVTVSRYKKGKVNKAKLKKGRKK